MSNVLENRPATTERPANRDALSPTLTAEIHRHLRYVLGTTPAEATPDEMLAAASHAVRNLVVDRMLVTRTRQAQSCRVAHVALTHEIGPRLAHDVHAMGLHHALDDALREVGLTLQDVARLEVPPALGTGDPADASLALLESLATHDLPATGYGLRFDYGLFRQVLVDGRQVEVPATWDAERSPWLIRRAAEAVWVPVFGRVAAQPPAPGEPASPWVDWQLLVGVPWDLPIVGHGGRTVQRLRLFSARADVDQDVTAFAPGDFTAAVRERLARESISKVVYPDDGSLEGEELRLLQA
ncbi:MAG: glycogen/starch/alpha-glucan phosphorylase, partial [Myxococcales bacterium]|nr:glycogen/starch/alpha-glucan phosphorylase [Myxococcales bacterium]